MDDAIHFWVIYENPSDYPGKFVVRKHSVRLKEGTKDTEIVIAPDCSLHNTLDDARGAVPPFLYRLGRQEGDDPCIADVWM